MPNPERTAPPRPAAARAPPGSTRKEGAGPGRSAKAQRHFGSSDSGGAAGLLPKHRSRGSHTHRSRTEPPLPPNTPKALQARGGDRKEESEGPASHTPTHRNVQTITMQVSGRLETSMLVPFWGDGLKNTNKILPLLSIFQPNHFGKRQQEKKKKPVVLTMRLVNNSTTREAVAHVSPEARVSADGSWVGAVAPLPRRRVASLGGSSAAEPKLHLWLISLSCHQS